MPKNPLTWQGRKNRRQGICLQCGDEIISYGNEIRKYCSLTCGRKFKYKKKHPPQSKTCKQCKQNFWTNRPNTTKYCSNNCRHIIKQSQRQNKPPTKNLKLRFKIFTRDKFKCQYCGRSPQNTEKLILQISHIIPPSKNGNNDPQNLITTCIECNIGKTDILLN